ncbi:hypothetical protein ACLMJK_000014 [Lecanora helva]
MSQSKNMLSQTLQSITDIKLCEIQKQREAFNSRKDKILAQVKAADSEHEKISLLLEGIVRVKSANADRQLSDYEDWELLQASGDSTLTNIRRFVDQSKYDPSIPDSMLQDFRNQLNKILEQCGLKLEYANLYSRLLTEWLSCDAAAPVGSTEESTLDGGFDIIERQKERLLQLSERFENVVFSPGDVDTEAITKLLTSLFNGEGAQQALKSLRASIRSFGEGLAIQSKPFSKPVLEWCIKGLLESDLLSNQKKTTLEDFIKDKTVLSEIADVLNMRFRDLRNWSWNADQGIPVAPRRQLNGKYRVIMDEDILQAIFLYYISMTWTVEFKAQLQRLVRDKDVWPWTQSMPRDEAEKREYYLGIGTSHRYGGIAKERQATYEQDFFMCQLPSEIDSGTGGYEDDDMDHRPRKTSSQNKRQQLLRTIGTEVLVNCHINHSVAVVQSDIQWFATSTSHAAVDMMLKFFGVPDLWTKFFRRYLEAPLRMVDLEGKSANVRTRKRGVPINSIFQKWFGELMVFTMDLAVNQEANMLLYRLHDDLWLCGEPEKCAKAWKVMESCATTLGLQFNDSKTGSVYLANGIEKKAYVEDTLPKGRVIMGFLELDPHSGDWVIDHKQVDAHIKQLKKQLEGCSSVVSWIQTWNSCIGRFFNYTFGQPANCFGQRHVDMILTTHKRMQQDLFIGSQGYGSVTEHLQKTVAERFKMSKIPDAFLYFPEALGGLGVRNPFISFLTVRNQLLVDPQGRMQRFLEDERKAYQKSKERFDALNERDRTRRLESILGKTSEHNQFIPIASAATHDDKRKEPTWDGPKDTEFMTFEEYTKYRETSSSFLKDAYDDLLRTPVEVNVEASKDVSEELSTLSYTQQGVIWSQLSSDHKWLIQLHSKEAFERFGSLSIVESGLLPMGVMNLLRKRKVVWQTVL